MHLNWNSCKYFMTFFRNFIGFNFIIYCWITGRSRVGQVIEKSQSKVAGQFPARPSNTSRCWPSLNSITSAYVCLFGKKYKTTNALFALDHAFKFHFSLQLPFSPDIDVPWVIITKRIYDIEHKSSPTIDQFIKDLDTGSNGAPTRKRKSTSSQASWI